MMKKHTGLLLTLLLSAVSCTEGDPPAAPSPATPPPYEEEFRRLQEKVPHFQVVALPPTGSVVLGPAQSLTVDDLRGVAIDDYAPQMKGTPPAYPAAMSTGGADPYVAPGIQPFRFRYFDLEFSYGGYHNWEIADYASRHGFNIILPYNRSVSACRAFYPDGTEWLLQTGLNWSLWMSSHGYPEGRYDLLPDVETLAEKLLEENHFPTKDQLQIGLYVEGIDQIMIDLEHPILSPESLRAQAWYPGSLSLTEQQAFENQYYAGYEATIRASIQCARAQGWKRVSGYGFAPFPGQWHGIENVRDPMESWWARRFQKDLSFGLDVLHPAVYFPYHHYYAGDRSVAWALATLDLNVLAVPNRARDIRPYVTTRIFTQTPGRLNAIRLEEARATAAAVFFTGVGGLVLWDTSFEDGLTNNHIVEVVPGADMTVKESFSASKEPGASPELFARYEIIRILEVVSQDVVRFQRILESGPNHGVGPAYPVYAASVELLQSHLRPKSEAIAAFIEGMALVKPFEYGLRHGEVKIDVAPQEQFRLSLPIVRRVKIGEYHIVITFDPGAVASGQGRTIALADFDGIQGLQVNLHADAQARIYVMKGP